MKSVALLFFPKVTAKCSVTSLNSIIKITKNNLRQNGYIPFYNCITPKSSLHQNDDDLIHVPHILLVIRKQKKKII